MKHHRTIKSFLVILTIFTFLLNGLPLTAQDLPPTEDLSLGAGVFVFRGGANKASQKKFIAKNIVKVKRTKVERAATTQKIRRQYETLAKVTASRSRVKPVAPQTVAAAQIGRKSPKETSILLTGAGQYAFGEKKYDEAIDYYRDAIDLDGTNQDAKLGISDALTAKGDDLTAREDARSALNFYNDAVKYNDKNSSAYAGLGAVYESLDDTDKAIANYETALKLDKELTGIAAPLGILYYQKSDSTKNAELLVKADDLLTRAYKADSSDAATDYYFGAVRYKQAKYDEAQTALQQSIKIDANQAAAHYYLGAVYDAQNKDASAITEYQEAVRLNDKYAEAYFNLGAIYYGQKNYPEAVKNYQQVVKLENTNGEAHANFGDVYREMGEFGKAEGEYRLATVFIKGDAELFSKYGYVLGKQFKWNNAVEQLNKAIALSADALDYTNLGWAYYNAAQVDLKSKREADGIAKLQQAKTALQKSVSMNANFAPAYLNLGLTLNDLKDYQTASVALKRATELRRNWVFAINELGISYRQLKDYGNAVQQFQKAVALDDKFAIGFYNLGEAQFRGGNAKDAKKTLDKLRKLNQNLANRLEIIVMGATVK